MKACFLSLISILLIFISLSGLHVIMPRWVEPQRLTVFIVCLYLIATFNLTKFTVKVVLNHLEELNYVGSSLQEPEYRGECLDDCACGRRLLISFQLSTCVVV